MAVPTGTDVQALLTAAGFPTVTFDLDGFVTASLCELSAMTGYAPFVAADTPEVRVYDPVFRGECLNLDCGFVGTPTVTVSGVSVTPGDACWLLPANAPNMGKPYEMIRFRDSTGTKGADYQTISITANFGYCLAADFPLDLFHAVTARAASLVLEGLMQGTVTLSGTDWKDGDVSESYGPQSGAMNAIATESLSSWAGQFRSTAIGYRRVNAYV